jgi:hypothetical protein
MGIARVAYASSSKLIRLCGWQEQSDCKSIVTATASKHRDCVDHFWRLHEQNPREDIVLEMAVMMARFVNDAGILEYLLSSGCPWDADEMCTCFTKRNVFNDRAQWHEWRDTFEVVQKYTPRGSPFRTLLSQKALEAKDLEFTIMLSLSGW